MSLARGTNSERMKPAATENDSDAQALPCIPAHWHLPETRLAQAAAGSGPWSAGMAEQGHQSGWHADSGFSARAPGSQGAEGSSMGNSG